MASVTAATAVNRLCILLDVDENLVKAGTTQWNSSLIERIKDLIHYKGFNEVDVFCVTGRNPTELNKIFHMNNRDVWQHHSLKNVRQKLETDFFGCQVRVATQLDAYVMGILKGESRDNFPIREIPQFSEQHYIDFEAEALTSAEPLPQDDLNILRNGNRLMRTVAQSFNARMDDLFKRTHYPMGESFLDAFQEAMVQPGWANKETLVRLIVNSLPQSDQLTVIFADDRDDNVGAVAQVLATSEKVDAFASILVRQDVDRINFIDTDPIELTVKSSVDSDYPSRQARLTDDVIDVYEITGQQDVEANHSPVMRKERVLVTDVEVAQTSRTNYAEKSWIETFAGVVGTFAKGALSCCFWLVRSLIGIFRRYTSS
jgi:hypothetical protein